ncbi:MAG: hypothetical protein IPH86_19385 [bacterium]|nr:hypothetical protein [bacterium]
MRERGNHTLQPTALVNEVYLKFDRQNKLDIQGRTHFLAMSATAMRQVLVDHARQRKAQKRGGDALLVELDESGIVDDGRAQDMLDLRRAGEAVRTRRDGGASSRCASSPASPRSRSRAS